MNELKTKKIVNYIGTNRQKNKINKQTDIKNEK